MKCKVCGGTGVIQGQAPGLVSCCPACGSKGFIEQTNEEWFCQLPTEEKAEFLAKKCCEISCKFFLGEAEEIFSRYWVEWLKEKHNGV